MAPVHFERTYGWMKAALISVGALLSGPVACSSSPATPAKGAEEPTDTGRVEAEQADLLIEGATLIDGTGAAPRIADIWIDDGAIIDITEEARDETASVVVDATGKYVIPGLWDVHVHFGSGGKLRSGAPEIARARRQFLWYGVTSVLSLGGTGGSTAEIVALRQRPAEAYQATEPHIYATGSMLTIPGSHPIGTVKTLPEGADPATYDWEEQGVTVVKTPTEARGAVKRHAGQGMDGIKIMVDSGPSNFGDDHPQMPPEMIAAVVEEAEARGIPVFAHVSSLDELSDIVEAGVRASAHAVMGPRVPPEQLELFRRMADDGIYYIPTLSVAVPHLTERWSNPDALKDPFLVGGVEPHVLESLEAGVDPILPPDTPARAKTAFLEAILGSIRAAHDAGVEIALGTDTNMPFVIPGHSTHVELEMLARAGLTPMEVLVAATRHPAEMLGIANEVGTLEVGKRADLLVLEKNPLESIRNSRTIDRIVKAGEVIDREQIFD